MRGGRSYSPQVYQAFEDDRGTTTDDFLAKRSLELESYLARESVRLEGESTNKAFLMGAAAIACCTAVATLHIFYGGSVTVITTFLAIIGGLGTGAAAVLGIHQPTSIADMFGRTPTLSPPQDIQVTQYQGSAHGEQTTEVYQ